jgi:hypothetical protein
VRTTSAGGRGFGLRRAIRGSSGRLWGASATNVLISLAAGILTFGFGYLGMQLQKLLPEDHMT